MKYSEKSYYRNLFENMNFKPCQSPAGLPPEGECWELAAESGGGYYWIYEPDDRYNIKIHDFWFREDTVIDLKMPEALSVTWYESISGEELNPYRKLNCHVVKSFLGGYEPFRALIHRNIPIRSIGIEYRPADPAAHLQSGVCGVDDGVHIHFCDVLADDGKGHGITCSFSDCAHPITHILYHILYLFSIKHFSRISS